MIIFKREKKHNRLEIINLSNEVHIRILLGPCNIKEWFLWLFIGLILAILCSISWIWLGDKNVAVFGFVLFLSIWFLIFSFWRFFLPELYQEIIVTSEHLSIKTGIVKNTYQLRDITNLRILENTNRILPYRPTLAFNYGKRIIQFGHGLDLKEAQQIVMLLKERFNI